MTVAAGGPHPLLQQQRTLTLRDGRRVSLSECGAPNGRPVLFFHPIQGNRLMPLTMHEASRSLGLRLLAFDRPGVGLSSPQPGRAVRDYPADVAELADQLGLRRFSLMASSAGTMYALACSLAPATRDRIAGKITIVAPWVPHSSRQSGGRGLLSLLGSWTPVPLLQAAVGLANGRIVQQSRSAPITQLMTRSTEEERAAFAADPANDELYRAMIGEWTASLGGIVQEMGLCLERAAPLHFSYSRDVSAPVRVYAGAADAVLPVAHAEQWAAAAPPGGVELVVVPGGTHDGVMHTHKRAALEALARDLDAEQLPPGGG